MVKLTNSLSGKKETFKPLVAGKVGMYTCGPTVYDDVHIGNLRAFLLSDIVRRVLEVHKYNVTAVMNITDVGFLSPDGNAEEDKMTKGLVREGKALTLEAMRELADHYIERFKKNLEALNIKNPTVMPRASDHIQEQVALVHILLKKDFAYKTSDGIYFDTSKDSQYGKLGGLSTEEHSQARVEGNKEKKNFRDFALWKFGDQGFSTTLGTGFPGWHIECSAMSEKYLGEHFDIHTGGMDLAPTHHNNEIAQSESAHGHPFVNYWLHNAFVNIEGGKMAKSQGNFLTLQSVIDKNISPLAYRYWLLTAHYRSPINFTWEAVEAAQNAYNKLRDHVNELDDSSAKPDSDYFKQFTDFVNDDLDTPKAIALMWEVVKDEKLASNVKRATLSEFDKVFGLKLDEKITVDIPNDVKKLVEEREIARKSKDWKKSDELRAEILEKGFEVKDTESGPKISGVK